MAAASRHVRTPIVMLATADWDNPFWTNKQHTALELVAQGCRLFYIESLGLRQPTLNSADRARILRRLLRALLPPRRVQPGLWVWSPMLVPRRLAPWLHPFNLWLLNLALQGWLIVLGFRRPWLWTYNPLTLEILRIRSFSAFIYHCVDDIKSQPGMEQDRIAAAEHALFNTADWVFTTSNALHEQALRCNARSVYEPNVMDLPHFAAARENTAAPLPADLAAIPEPRLGFVGAISGYKLDFALLRSLAERHHQWQLVLIGAVGEGDPWTDIALLEGCRNVHLLGPRDYQQLPSYLRGFQVALLPCQRNAYTRAMFPMKFFEYLAAGVPVVSVPLEALQEFRAWAHFVEGVEGFEEAITQVLAGPPAPPPLQALRPYTYRARTERMLQLLRRHQ